MVKSLSLFLSVGFIAFISQLWKHGSSINYSCSNLLASYYGNNDGGQRRQLFLFNLTKEILFFDPRTVSVKDAHTDLNDYVPIKVCNRIAPLTPRDDIHNTNEHATSCPLLHAPTEHTTILLLDHTRIFGRTGNNLIEFFHSLQYGKDKGMVVGMMQEDWPTRMISEMWMAVQNDDIIAWNYWLENTYCIRVFTSSEQLFQYKEVFRLRTRELFYYHYEGSRHQYIEFQSRNIRALWRSYNNGTGLSIQHGLVRDMCSAVHAVFGSNFNDATIYSVVHSRSLESEGIALMNEVCGKLGCDLSAGLEMQPDYVKAILGPLGLLNYPIIFMSDHQRPEILDGLLADPDIGQNIRIIPLEASWKGGDMTLAILANAFIGNPASTFSGFIANSRFALGFNHNYLYRRKEDDGHWVDVCDDSCSFGQFLDLE